MYDSKNKQYNNKHRRTNFKDEKLLNQGKEGESSRLDKGKFLEFVEIVGLEDSKGSDKLGDWNYCCDYESRKIVKERCTMMGYIRPPIYRLLLVSQGRMWRPTTLKSSCKSSKWSKTKSNLRESLTETQILTLQVSLRFVTRSRSTDYPKMLLTNDCFLFH